MSFEPYDPHIFPWVESGVSGLARSRRWDATALVEAPELDGLGVREVELVARESGIQADPEVPAAALERIAAELEPALRRPYRARAVRTGGAWAVGGVELHSEEVGLPSGVEASSLEVVRPPGEARFVLVDGEEAAGPLEGALAAAVEEIDARGLARFDSFAARADKVGGDRWDLTIDPL